MKPTLLVVEDDPDHAFLVLRALDRLGVSGEQVTHVMDGQAALDVLEGGLDPDLILLDLRLPKIDGLEVLARLKADPDRNRIPVVMLTTSRAEADVARAYAHHVNSYLVKPPRLDALRALMAQVVQYWLETNEPPPGNGTEPP
ncbi:MAG: response regulator [Myxococcales bacterium]|nr:response regulator [Myxococcales bacterium]MCB9537273.1 response regulator [Myxococcales bacterium]